MSDTQGQEIVVLETSMGIIELNFFPDKAAKHVQNFQKLVKEGFFSLPC